MEGDEEAAAEEDEVTVMKGVMRQLRRRILRR